MNDSSFHVYSQKYPPVGQSHTGLGTVELEVVCAEGTRRFDPNSAAIASQTGTLFGMLGEPVARSAISGEPAYLYRNSVVQIPLTAEEIARLFAHSLEPQEWLVLAREYGVFYEIMSTFYDEDTGLALSPNYSHAQRVAREAVESVPHVLLVRANDFWQMHSIVGLEQSEGIYSDLASQGYCVSRIPLVSPNDSADLTLLDNVIALHMLSDGALRAFGPYKHTAAAELAGADLAFVSVGRLPSFVV